MAIDDSEERVLAVARNPAKLAAFAMNDGSVIAQTDTCQDADDVFLDARRHCVYVSCGEGYIDVFARHGAGYERVAHIATVAGARTSLFSPELDRLYLAVRATFGEPASIWVFRPTP